ncbi:MAG: TetR/AcrR family transcriptional regulator [Xanthomonadales bacterium]|nr:TetR family transcriptional regulator [Gammaproteobacteria bacterium]MBT8051642.1 TetR family transcriptional regulator [Gammaproteobacteria bacterium]MBT8057661.1 TetR family transcriptional regulator [Gammaproteobacteria bacterium]NNJ77747.1 TetR/AcrR family transcriptional regulator [Xanthomonadales bacterium]NNL04950.1 TetR/AcrR family transcriptional regulator [Xanthomonadales bacterium]
MDTNETPQAGRRGRGRPPGRQSSALREMILDIAEERFAFQGYAATSLREIAEQADVNPAMVHYYFGSKRDLLRQVLERSFEPLGQALADLAAEDHVPPATVSRVLSRAVRQHPKLPLLVVREVMLPGGVMQKEFLETMAPRLGGALPGIVAREQAQLRMSPELDPGIVSLLLLALSVFPFIVRGVAEPALGIRYDKAGLQSLEEHVLRLLNEGLTT